MLRTVMLGLTVAVGCYAVLCALLFLFQRSFVYFPSQSHGEPERMRLATEAGSVFVATRERTGSGAVIYFGGNAEDVSFSLPDLEAAFPNRALYALHYRGYGGSAGSPSEAALVADAEMLFDRARAKHDRVIVAGRSLGSGIAIQLASRREVERLILVTPFDSLVEVGARHFPIVPVRWLLRDRYESWRYAPKVTAPVTMVIAAEDEIIPRDSSDRLRAAFAAARVALVVIPDVGHNTISFAGEYTRALQDARQKGDALPQ